MANPTGQQNTPKTKKPQILSEQEKPAFREKFHNAVARRAYNLFEQLGREDGNDVSHWLQAEEQLLKRLPEVRESNGSYIVNASLPDVSVENVQVWVDQDQAIISAEKTLEDSSVDEINTETASAFFSVKWPEKVDPETASAQIKDGIVTLTVRKIQGSGKAAGASASARNPRSGSQR